MSDQHYEVPPVEYEDGKDDYSDHYHNPQRKGLISSLSDGGTDKKELTEDYSEFKALSEHDVTVNLKFLSNVQDGEKIMIVDGKSMRIDQRYGQFARRWMSGDSREKVIKFVRYVIAAAKNCCNIAVNEINNTKNIKTDREYHLQTLIKFHADLNAARSGLGRMAITYSDDKQNHAQIETIQIEVDTFCNEHLKKVITK
jgi:hypothetical protein